MQHEKVKKNEVRADTLLRNVRGQTSAVVRHLRLDVRFAGLCPPPPPGRGAVAPAP